MAEFTDELKASLEKLNSLDIEKYIEQSKGQESLIGGWKKELGDVRPLLEEAAKGHTSALPEGVTKESLKTALDKLDRINDTVLSKLEKDPPRSNKEPPTEPKTAEEWKEHLRKNGKLEIAEAQWKKMTQAQRDEIHRKPGEYEKFYAAANTSPDTAPNSLLDDGTGSTKDKDNPYLKFFAAEQRGQHVPGARSGMPRVSGGTVADGGEQSLPRTPTGHIPRPGT